MPAAASLPAAAASARRTSWHGRHGRRPGSAHAGAFWENLSSAFPARAPPAAFDAAFLRRGEEQRGAAGAAGGKGRSMLVGALQWEEGGCVPPVSPGPLGILGWLADAWGSKPHTAPSRGVPRGLLPEQGEGAMVLLRLRPSSGGHAARPELLGEGQEFAGCDVEQKPPGAGRDGGGPSRVPASPQAGGFQRWERGSPPCRGTPTKLQAGLHWRLPPAGPDPARGENPALCPGTAQSIPGDLPWEGG